MQGGVSVCQIPPEPLPGPGGSNTARSCSAHGIQGFLSHLHVHFDSAGEAARACLWVFIWPGVLSQLGLVTTSHSNSARINTGYHLLKLHTQTQRWSASFKRRPNASAGSASLSERRSRE